MSYGTKKNLKLIGENKEDLVKCIVDSDDIILFDQEVI